MSVYTHREQNAWRERHDDAWKRGVLALAHHAYVNQSISEIEQRIRARERQTVAWLAEKPWLAGADLADTVAACRRAHTESIRREFSR